MSKITFTLPELIPEDAPIPFKRTSGLSIDFEVTEESIP